MSVKIVPPATITRMFQGYGISFFKADRRPKRIGKKKKLQNRSIMLNIMIPPI